MFKLLGGNKSNEEGGMDLDNKSKAIIQDMSSDSEESPSPMESSNPSVSCNLPVQTIQFKSKEMINNDIKINNKSDRSSKQVNKKPKVQVTSLSDSSSSSDSDDSDTDSDDSVDLDSKANLDDESYSESEESSDSEEMMPVKPVKKEKPSKVNGVNHGVKNKLSNDESMMPKKKIRLSEARNASMKKDELDRLKNRKDEVFCGGLPFSITEEQVRDLFEDDCGEIVKINVLDGKGIAFIKFTREEYASKAVEYDGTEFMGRKLRINLSCEKGKSSTPRRGIGSDNPPSNEICVRNINYKTSEDTMRNIFSECGNITRCHIPVYEDTGKPLGRCFIAFDSIEEATKALEFDNTEIDGRSVSISYATPRANRDRGKNNKGRPNRPNHGNNFNSNSNINPNRIEIAKPGSKSIVFEDSD